ncbi:MAG: macrolide ABC transporter ATP-binding protein [Thermoplasmata archaeon]|nr:macrolide ABC transporter ATP-binding protein [Thermoplasmata archaeon]
MAVALRTQELWKVYDTGSVKVKALRGVDLEIKKGEMVAIMGPSGCGKTTFLNCVSSLDDFTAGEVFVDGVALSVMSDYERTNMRANRLGFVFQSFNLIPVLSAVENVELPLVMQGYSAADARKKALNALDSVGLKEWAGHLPAELSGGQQQRVTIARAFVHEPAVILADEPTGNLDMDTSESIMDLLVDLNRNHGITFVLVTHEEEIAKLCTRLVTIRDGQIIEDRRLEGKKVAAPAFEDTKIQNITQNIVIQDSVVTGVVGKINDEEE